MLLEVRLEAGSGPRSRGREVEVHDLCKPSD